MERWAEYYSRNPNAPTTESVDDDFDLETLLGADESQWEDILSE